MTPEQDRRDAIILALNAAQPGKDKKNRALLRKFFSSERPTTMHAFESIEASEQCNHCGGRKEDHGTL